MQIKMDDGGTHAGWRRAKPQAKDYTCECGARNKYYWLACPVCSTPRPSED